MTIASDTVQICAIAGPLPRVERAVARLVVVSALSDLLAARTSLDDAQIDHLQRLVGEWQLLSDLAFADLLLWVPVELHDGEAGSDRRFLCAAQCRPTTGPTAYQHDQVGGCCAATRAAPLRIGAAARARIFREGDPDWDGDLPIRREAIPVRLDGGDGHRRARPDANLASVRTPSQLELVYLQSAADLAGDGRRRHVPGSGRRAARRAPARASATA